MLCQLDRIWKYYGGEPVLRDVCLTINEGERIGLVGRNGSGKTTLLSIITKRIDYDLSPENEGGIGFSGNCKIGYLEQGVGLSAECSVYEEMRKPFSHLDSEYERARLLESLMADLTGSERERAESEYSRLMTHYEDNEGYLTDVKIKTVLNGMGFMNLETSRSVNSLSGGERTRLALAKLLLESPSLLILDEPTNHLDLDTMTWLENHLESYKGTVLAVSHNRYFLDKVCTRICEIEDGVLTSYSGNYSFFLQKKKEDTERQLKLYEQEQEKISQLQFFIDKNRVRATSASASKSKQHMLDRIVENAVEKPKLREKAAGIKLTYDIEPPQEVLKVDNLDVSVGGKTLVQSFSLNMRRGDKVGIIGANGTGKTTILKTLLGLNPHQSGRVAFAQNVRTFYFDQKCEYLGPENTLMEEIHNRYPRMSDFEVRSALGRVLLTGESVFKKVGVISGGERTKLNFALMSLKKANFLILDEPTNHLDISTKEVLEDALCKFTGTILFVSHDRYLLNKIAGRILELKDGVITEYKGNYDDYLAAKELMEKSREAEAVPTPKAPEKKQYRTKSQRADDVKRKQEISGLESKIEALEAEINSIQESLSSPDSDAGYEKINEMCLRLDSAKNELGEAIDLWLILQGDV